MRSVISRTQLICTNMINKQFPRAKHWTIRTITAKNRVSTYSEEMATDCTKNIRYILPLWSLAESILETDSCFIMLTSNHMSHHWLVSHIGFRTKLVAHRILPICYYFYRLNWHRHLQIKINSSDVQPFLNSLHIYQHCKLSRRSVYSTMCVLLKFKLEENIRHICSGYCV